MSDLSPHDDAPAMANDPPPYQAAALHGLASNRSLPIVDRLGVALVALDLYEAERDAALAHRAQDPLIVERNALLVEVDAMRAVVEAAKALVGDWRAKRSTHGGNLTAAVDTYIEAHAPSEPAVDLAPDPDEPTNVGAGADPWRLAAWHSLPDECLIAGCDNTDIDQRGPVNLRTGTIRKACVEHWEGIFRILGDQASWERTDAAHSAPTEAGS